MVLPVWVCTELDHFLRESQLVDHTIALHSSVVCEDSPAASRAMATSTSRRCSGVGMSWTG